MKLKRFNESLVGIEPDSNGNVYFILSKEYVSSPPKGTVAYKLSPGVREGEPGYDGNYELQDGRYRYVLAKDIEGSPNWERIDFHDLKKMGKI